MNKPWIKFLGVIGSFPVGDCGDIKLGGDTSCAAVSYENVFLFLDAGSGMRKGADLKSIAKRARQPIGIFISHPHIDHYLGLPFCPLIYDNKLKFNVFGPDDRKEKFGKILDRALKPPFFPIRILSKKNICATGVGTRPFLFNKIRITPHQLNHPGGALGYRFDFPNGKKLAFASDNEPSDRAALKALATWARRADVLIHDAQYSPREYKKHKGWGHSPYTYPIDVAKDAQVRMLILYHHNPERGATDWKKYKKDAVNYAKKKGVKILFAQSNKRVFI